MSSRSESLAGRRGAEGLAEASAEVKSTGRLTLVCSSKALVEAILGIGTATSVSRSFPLYAPSLVWLPPSIGARIRITATYKEHD